MSHIPPNDRLHPKTLSQPGQSRIIGTVLTPAVRLWLRSLLERVEDLQVKIQGGDRLLLTGCIPKVSLSARHAVYQGLHLRQIHIVAETIRINLGQVLKGKPLRLLEPIGVTGELLLLSADLQASLQGTLLPSGLNDFLARLLVAGGLKNPAEVLENRQLTWREIVIDSGAIELSGILVDKVDDRKQDICSHLVIRAGVQLASGNELQFVNTQIEGLPSLNLASLDGLKLDLGPQVDIEELTLSPGQLVCRGRASVIP